MTTEIMTDEHEYKTETETSGDMPSVKLEWPDATDNRKELFQSAFNRAYSDPTIGVMFEDEPLRLSCFGRMETSLHSTPDKGGFYGDDWESKNQVCEELFHKGYVRKVVTYRQAWQWHTKRTGDGGYDNIKVYTGSWSVDKTEYEWNPDYAELLPTGWSNETEEGALWNYAEDTLKAPWMAKQREKWTRAGQRQGMQLAMCGICPLFGRCAVLSGNLKGVATEDY